MTDLEDHINDAADRIREVRDALSHTYYLDGEINDAFTHFDVDASGFLEVEEFGVAIKESSEMFGLPAFPPGSDGEAIIAAVLDE